MGMLLHVLHVALLVFCVCAATVQAHVDTIMAVDFLTWFNPLALSMKNKVAEAYWEYDTNLTDHNKARLTEVKLESANFRKEQAKNASRFDLSGIHDDLVKRQIKFVLDIGVDAHDDTSVIKRINDISSELFRMYSSAKWCKAKGECYALEPGLTDLLTTSRNHTVLRDAWCGWRDVSGKKMRKLYAELVSLLNTAITSSGKYKDAGEYYRSRYETDSFEGDVKTLYEELQPLYTQLHAYVRRKLRLYYGKDKFPDNGLIPAHLLGDMWSQYWDKIYDILEPYPDVGLADITKTMKEQNYTARNMFELAEHFFISLGMNWMTKEFWRNSMLEKPTDGREVVCHATAFDFFKQKDFRIKQCATVTEEQLIVAHHEMGHIQYYMEYRNQPVLFRGGANPGFHEGVADIVTISFKTPRHLRMVSLLDKLPNGTDGAINVQLKQALFTVAFLPFSVLMDQWRWSVFRGETTPDDYNAKWWELRQKYQGICPPIDVKRTEADFDPGAKFHIAANVPYIRYFVSMIVQYQWHKALCELSAQGGHISECDIYQQFEAGSRLREMLRMGSSRHWSEAMYTMTRGTAGETRKMSARPLLEYFAPLLEWLKAENIRTKEVPGWEMPGNSSARSCTLPWLLITLQIFAAIQHIL